MAGLDPAIPDFYSGSKQGVDARVKPVKPGHDAIHHHDVKRLFS
jgi:hypothetical protein